MTCAICAMSRHYKVVYRQYGQFSCVGCCKFWKKFLESPQRYKCEGTGECWSTGSLKLKLKCDACRAKKCFDTYTHSDRNALTLQPFFQKKVVDTSNFKCMIEQAHITCPVCTGTYFYRSLQRRYGQFACVSCYRFIRAFLLAPARYVCDENGNCSLKQARRCKVGAKGANDNNNLKLDFL